MSGLDPFQYLDVGFPYSDLYDGSFVCVAWIGRVRFIPGCFENNQCGKLRLIFRAGSCNCQGSAFRFGFHLRQKRFPQRLLPAVVCGAGSVVYSTLLLCSLSTLGLFPDYL